ncbi:MAG: hypothetical protein M1825_001646 [Sarcosagium campestre]|nr:MAG: hypothetical protein M1825_001646 [Sarcosagium campestre]
MPTTTDRTTKAGIKTSDTGERHIPASTRPDGSTRREIKIRPGYRPPEDVEVYKNRTADAWKTRGTGGIPGAAPAAGQAEDDQQDEAGSSKAGNKNAKRREARKKAKAAAGGEADGSQPVPDNNGAVSARKDDEESRSQPEGSNVDPAAERDKEARKLQKKLRQARELREKKESGQNLLPEQFEKVIRINELIRQLDSLGFDPDGQPKE